MWSSLDSTSSWLWMAVWKVVALCQMGWTFRFLSHSRLMAPQVCRLSLSQALMWRNSNISAHVLFLAQNMHHDCDSRSSLLSNRSLSILTPSSLSCPLHLCLISTSRVARICSWCGLQIIIFFFMSIRKVIHFREKKPDSYCNKFTFVVCAVLRLVTQSNRTLCDPMDYSPAGSSVHGNSPGKNTWVGCHALLQGTLPTQGSNPGLPHCGQILYCLSHQRSPNPPLLNIKSY